MNARRLKEQGFTVLELIVSLVIFIVLITAVFSVTLSTTDLYRTDQSRIGVNRNARSSYDLIGNDVRQSGERLTADFPAITITQDAAKNSVLTLRRGLADAALPLCAPVNAGGVTVYVNANNPSNVTLSPGLTNMPAACTTDLQDTNSFNSQIAAGNTTGYIYDTKSGTGSWIKVTGTANGSSNSQTLTISGLTASYDPRKTSTSDPGRDIRIYLLEERKYSVSGGTLTMALNNGTPNIATPNVQAFVVRPYLEGNPPTATTLPFPTGVISGHTVAWRDVAFMDLDLTLSETHGNRTVQRTVSERYNPRNALSGQ